MTAVEINASEFGVGLRAPIVGARRVVVLECEARPRVGLRWTDQVRFRCLQESRFAAGGLTT